MHPQYIQTYIHTTHTYNPQLIGASQAFFNPAAYTLLADIFPARLMGSINGSAYIHKYIHTYSTYCNTVHIRTYPPV